MAAHFQIVAAGDPIAYQDLVLSYGFLQAANQALLQQCPDFGQGAHTFNSGFTCGVLADTTMNWIIRKKQECMPDYIFTVFSPALIHNARDTHEYTGIVKIPQNRDLCIPRRLYQKAGKTSIYGIAKSDPLNDITYPGVFNFMMYAKPGSKTDQNLINGGIPNGNLGAPSDSDVIATCDLMLAAGDIEGGGRLQFGIDTATGQAVRKPQGSAIIQPGFGGVLEHHRGASAIQIPCAFTTAKAKDTLLPSTLSFTPYAGSTHGHAYCKCSYTCAGQWHTNYVHAIMDYPGECNANSTYMRSLMTHCQSINSTIGRASCKWNPIPDLVYSEVSSFCAAQNRGHIPTIQELRTINIDKSKFPPNSCIWLANPSGMKKFPRLFLYLDTGEIAAGNLEHTCKPYCIPNTKPIPTPAEINLCEQISLQHIDLSQNMVFIRFDKTTGKINPIGPNGVPDGGIVVIPIGNNTTLAQLWLSLAQKGYLPSQYLPYTAFNISSCGGSPPPGLNMTYPTSEQLSTADLLALQFLQQLQIDHERKLAQHPCYLAYMELVQAWNNFKAIAAIPGLTNADIQLVYDALVAPALQKFQDPNICGEGNPWKSNNPSLMEEINNYLTQGTLSGTCNFTISSNDFNVSQQNGTWYLTRKDVNQSLPMFVINGHIGGVISSSMTSESITNFGFLQFPNEMGAALTQFRDNNANSGHFSRPLQVQWEPNPKQITLSVQAFNTNVACPDLTIVFDDISDPCAHCTNVNSCGIIPNGCSACPICMISKTSTSDSTISTPTISPPPAMPYTSFPETTSYPTSPTPSPSPTSTPTDAVTPLLPYSDPSPSSTDQTLSTPAPSTLSTSPDSTPVSTNSTSMETSPTSPSSSDTDPMSNNASPTLSPTETSPYIYNSFQPDGYQAE